MAEVDLLPILWIVTGLGLVGLLVWYWRQKKIALLTDPEQIFERPESRLSLSDCEVAYFEFGRGPVLLLLHGLGASHFCWRRLVPLLAKEFRVIVIDLPGFGLSSKDLNISYALEPQTKRLVEFLTQLQLGPVCLVGSSMGGLIGLHLAAQHPQRISGLVVLAPPLNRRLALGLGTKMAWSGTLFRKMLTPLIMKRILTLVYADSRHADPSAIAGYLKPYQVDPKSVTCLLRALECIRHSQPHKWLRSLKVRVLALHGGRDQIVPLAKIQSDLECIPRVRIKVKADIGHHPQEEDPEWVASLITEFVRHPSN